MEIAWPAISLGGVSLMIYFTSGCLLEAKHCLLNYSAPILSINTFKILFILLYFFINFWFWLRHWIELRVSMKRAIFLKILRVLLGRRGTFFGAYYSWSLCYNEWRPWISKAIRHPRYHRVGSSLQSPFHVTPQTTLHPPALLVQPLNIIIIFFSPPLLWCDLTEKYKIFEVKSKGCV